MFWQRYLKLCNSVNKSPNLVAAEIGVKSSGTVTGWKNGAAPRHSVLVKLSDYFDVDISELTGNDSFNVSSHPEKNFVFYKIYAELCEKHGEKPYTLSVELGSKSNSAVAQWQKGSVPRGEMLQKIATHFNVSVEYLLTGKNEKSPAPKSAELIPGYSDLSEEEKKKVSDYIDLLLAARQKE